MKAIISDIHGNLEALCNVFSDIDKNEVDEIICLGDIVGYGADSEACIDLIMDRVNCIVLGNHDNALINGPVGFNKVAADIINLTHKKMLPPELALESLSMESECFELCFEPSYYSCSHAGKKSNCYLQHHSKSKRWDFINNLPSKIDKDGILYVHGSPLNPTYEYVLPDKFQRWDPKRISTMFELFETISFCGHTHHPCAILSNTDCFYPEEHEYVFYVKEGEKCLVNVGSVGQPRDRDPRASYVLYDEVKRTIQWRRIEYNIEGAAKKIEKMCGKGNYCAKRLFLGR